MFVEDDYFMQEMRMDKQEMFEAFCEYCTDPAQEDPMTGWLADMQMKFLKDTFEFYYDFFKEFMQQNPGSI